VSAVGRGPGGAATTEDGAALARVARGGLWNLAGAGAAATTNVLLVLLVTRGAPAGVAGTLFAATSVFLVVATAARLGTATGLVYWVARLRAQGRAGEVGRVLRLGLVPVLLAGVLGGAGLWAAAGWVAGWVTPSQSGLMQGYLRGLAVLLPAGAALEAVLAASRGLGTMRATVVVDKLLRPLLQVLATVLVLAVGSLDQLALAWALPYAAAAVLAVVWLLALLGRPGAPAGAPAEAPLGGGPLPAGQFWRFTLPRAASSLVQLSLQRLDVVLVAALAGPVEAAVYTAATRFLVVGQLGGQAVSTAVQPRLAALMAAERVADAGRLYQLATGWVVLVTWPLYLASAVLAEDLVGVFGDGYGAGAAVVRVLALAMLVATACGAVDAVLNMAGRTTWTLANSATALVVMVVVDLLLVPSAGALGAAVGWGLAIGANNLLPLAQLRWAYGLHPFGRGALTAAALSAAAAVPLVAAGVLGLPAPLQGAAACAGALLLAVGAARLRRPLALDLLPLPRRRRGGPGGGEPVPSLAGPAARESRTARQEVP